MFSLLCYKVYVKTGLCADVMCNYSACKRRARDCVPFTSLFSAYMSAREAPLKWKGDYSLLVDRVYECRQTNSSWTMPDLIHGLTRVIVMLLK